MLADVDINAASDPGSGSGGSPDSPASSDIATFLTEKDLLRAEVEAELRAELAASAEAGAEPVDARIWSQMLADRLKPLVDTSVGKFGVKTYERFGVEVFGGPSVEKIGQ